MISHSKAQKENRSSDFTRVLLTLKCWNAALYPSCQPPFLKGSLWQRRDQSIFWKKWLKTTGWQSSSWTSGCLRDGTLATEVGLAFWVKTYPIWDFPEWSSRSVPGDRLSWNYCGFRVRPIMITGTMGYTSYLSEYLGAWNPDPSPGGSPRAFA